MTAGLAMAVGPARTTLAAKRPVAAPPIRAYVGTAREFDHGRQDPLRQPPFPLAAVEATQARPWHPARGRRPPWLPAGAGILDDPARPARALGGYSVGAALASPARSVVASPQGERRTRAEWDHATRERFRPDKRRMTSEMWTARPVHPSKINPCFS